MKPEKIQPTITVSLPSGQVIDFILVEGGEYFMGDDNGRYDWEKPAHRVKVSSFYIGQYPLTQSLWQVITGENPSEFKGENRPVDNVSWNDVQDFIIKLNEQTGQQFRLPTEAEWEYAARGGKYSQGYTYSGSDQLKQVGWYEENSNGETHEVGLMLANELGVYDMSGNVWEWCADWFGEKYYEKCRIDGVVENPHGPGSSGDRVIRGGSYFYSRMYCRATDRYWDRPGDRRNSFGFRLVLLPQSVG